MLRYQIYILFLLITALLDAQPSDTTLPAVRVPLEDCASIDTAAYGIRITPKESYAAARAMVQNKKAALAKRYGGRKNRDSLHLAAKALLEEAIVNILIPFWYGTEWDFNGYSPAPRTGTIACGYFVSTLMQHCGFNLNRYTIARQAPLYEALTYELGDSVCRFETDYAGFAEAFKKNNGEGLYFAGLTCHVGFLLYRNGELFFIHSSYMSPFRVVIEKAACSAPFNATSEYVVARISGNQRLLDRWISGAAIKTRMP